MVRDVVANAGTMNPATIEDMTVKDFDDLSAVNVCAPYFLAQQLLPILGSWATASNAESISRSVMTWSLRPSVCAAASRSLDWFTANGNVNGPQASTLSTSEVPQIPDGIAAAQRLPGRASEKLMRRSKPTQSPRQRGQAATTVG